mgnify:CR=1 FL=1
MNIFSNTIIIELLILFILFIPIIIKLFSYGNIHGKCSKNKTRIIGFGTFNAFTHLIQGFLFGICLRLSNLDLIFLIFAYILGTIYPIYNLTKRLYLNSANFRDSSFYINLADFTTGFTFAIIGIETYNQFTGKLNTLKINVNIIYYFIILYLSLTIISLMFSFTNPQSCLI